MGHAYVDAIARSHHQQGDPRSLPQLRADIATSLLQGHAKVSECSGRTDADCEPSDATPTAPGSDGGALTGPTGAGAPTGTSDAAVPGSDPGSATRDVPKSTGDVDPRPRVRAKIQLNVPLTTLLGLGDRPGEMGGFGPIVAEVARRVVANHLDNPDARFAVGVTHPVTGQLLHLHALAGRFLRGLARDLLDARDQTCVWTTCRRPAHSCDADHTIPYADGGPTHPYNSAPECGWHHKVKGKGGWRLRRPRPGHFRWTSPHGHSYTVTPPRLTDPDPPADHLANLPGGLDPPPPF
jgi:hypothetical protein